MAQSAISNKNPLEILLFWEKPSSKPPLRWEKLRVQMKQLKLCWELKCENRPWDLCDQKCVSLLYLRIGKESRRFLIRKEPHAVISELTTTEVRTIMEAAFARPRKITFDRYLLFSRKQKRERVQSSFSSTFKESAEKYSFKGCEETITRDVFIRNMSNTKIQVLMRLRETSKPSQMLQTAIYIKIGE